MFVKGGYLEVQTHAITVLADMAIRAKDLDGRAALEAKKAAEDAMAQRTSREEIAAAEVAVDRGGPARGDPQAAPPRLTRGAGRRPQPRAPPCSGQARPAVR